MEVRASTMGSEIMVTAATPNIRKEKDLRQIFHFGSSSSLFP